MSIPNIPDDIINNAIQGLTDNHPEFKNAPLNWVPAYLRQYLATLSKLEDFDSTKFYELVTSNYKPNETPDDHSQEVTPNNSPQLTNEQLGYVVDAVTSVRKTLSSATAAKSPITEISQRQIALESLKKQFHEDDFKIIQEIFDENQSSGMDYLYGQIMSHIDNKTIIREVWKNLPPLPEDKK